MDKGFVEIKIEESSATISFHHPKSNSLPSEILKKLAGAFSNLSKDNNVKVILLKSEGEKAFCAGASFDELIEIKDYESGKEFFMGFARVINTMRKTPQFIVTRVQGKAVGGGVGLIAASDYVIASSEASIKLSELALGIGPFVVGPAVERKIGKAAFTEMSIDHDWRTAAWALSKGLYTKLYDSQHELDEAVNEIVHKLSACSPEAMSELKKIFWDGTNKWDELLESRAELSGRLVLSDFTKKFIQSFKNKN